MKKNTLILFSMLICFQPVALANEKALILMRTNTGMATGGNQLIIQTDQNGNIELTFPKYHIYNGEVIKFKHDEKPQSLFTSVSDINYQWNIDDLKLKLKQIKVDTKQSLFYSSDSDIINLSIVENDEKIWQISINNFQELKHYYQYLDEWQTLVDVIENMESLSRRSVVSKHRENHNEK